jgi:polyribonucleotide nucleotidyltransferase
MVKKFSLPDFGYEVEIGKVARQADGAVWFTHGGTVVLSTATASPSSEFPGFLPLTVDYREQYAAAGKIPGGYYKREGKSSDKEVLTSRVIDRSIRPIFPDHYFDQIQVLSTVYSVDRKQAPSIMALNASSLALCISDIPFLGPVGGVEVARIDGKWVVNPAYEDTNRADATLIVAGTKEGICMIEGTSDEISEADFVDAAFMAHEQIKKIVAWQEEIIKEVGKSKRPVDQSIDWNVWSERALDFLTEERVKKTFVVNKKERSEELKELQSEFSAYAKTFENEVEIPERILSYLFEEAFKKKFTDLVFSVDHRVDNRAFDQVRDISVDVGLLPFAHGSSLFTRGQTQALTSVTFGGGQDTQRVESIMEDDAADRTFMLNYNFPPFSVGEVRPMRGPGRREVGHGYLAASSFKFMLPNKEAFPYTIRIVTDILESNGSSSMATVCGSTMAMMQGGVPIKKMVSGVAMGLLRSSTGDIHVLTDISGFEDNFGLMDFKVAGTDQGITAIQMDIKHKGGFGRNVFESALKQAHKGRLHILGEMRKCMTKPADEMSALVPKVISFKIDNDKIGAVIGSGGKMIREIIETTGVTSIDIEDDGTVKIFGVSAEKLDKATNWVKVLAGQIKAGDRFEGKVRRIVDFGIFVELVPGQDGLVHVSSIPRDKQRSFQNMYKLDEIVPIEVIDYDSATGRIRLRILEDK